MTRPSIIVFLTFHALLSYVDSTSNLPHVPGNVQPSAKNSNDAPAKKVLKAEDTMANEERFASGWMNKIKSYIPNKRLERQKKVLKNILPQDPKLQHPLPLDSIRYSLEHDKMSSSFWKFMGEDDKLLKALSDTYGGVDRFVSGLLLNRNVGGVRQKNARKLLRMQQKSWKRNGVDSDEAFKQLKLKDEKPVMVIFDTRVTYLEDYIKLKSRKKNVDVEFFGTLERGFGGRDNFVGLFTKTMADSGMTSKRDLLTIGKRYMAYLEQVDKKNSKAFGSMMDKLEQEIKQPRGNPQTVVINVVRRKTP